MTGVKEAQLLIVEENRREQDEVNNAIRANYVKRAARIIKQGRSYDDILSTVAKLLSVTKTMGE